MNAACKPRWLARLSLLAAVALVVTACVDERSFVITGNAADCKGGSGNVMLAGGVLDVSAGAGYYFSPIVRNDLLDSKAGDGEPERNVLQVEGFEIDLELGDLGGAIGSEYTSTFSYAAGFVEPSGGEMEFSGVELISPQLVAQLPGLGEARPTIVAKVRARAQHNGSTLTSVEFAFPVSLCEGCLVINGGDCPATKPSGVVTNECGLPQDEPVYCCSASGTLVCLDKSELDALPEAT